MLSQRLDIQQRFHSNLKYLSEGRPIVCARTFRNTFAVQMTVVM
jgi:hypothetical protein